MKNQIKGGWHSHTPSAERSRTRIELAQQRQTILFIPSLYRLLRLGLYSPLGGRTFSFHCYFVEGELKNRSCSTSLGGRVVDQLQCH